MIKLDFNGFYFHIANKKVEKVTLKFQKDVFVISYLGQDRIQIKNFEIQNIGLSNNFNRKELHVQLTSLCQSSLVTESLDYNNMTRMILTHNIIQILLKIFQ